VPVPLNLGAGLNYPAGLSDGHITAGASHMSAKVTAATFPLRLNHAAQLNCNAGLNDDSLRTASPVMTGRS
jgi:hypothetical protein